MKTMLNLPDEVVHRLEERAVRDGRSPEEVAAELLSAALPSELQGAATSGHVVPKTLPLIKARPAELSHPKALSGQEWCDWIKEVEMQEEVERYEGAFGHQYVDRADR